MPALYTHYTFGNSVLNNVNKKLQKEIKSNLNYYNMFNQGFDNLYYYLRKWNYYRDFGISCHKKKIDLFFTNAITYIKENNLENDSTCTNMVYGILNHYILDTIIHPFINYQVDNVHIEHTKIEFIIDAYIFNYLSDVKWKGTLYKTLIPKLKFNDNLINLLDYTFTTTHNEKNIGKIFNKSHNLGYYIYRYFINDYYGIKSFFYKIVDFILRRKDIRFSKTTFRVTEKNMVILNMDKNNWHHPKDKNKIYNYSLEELYKASLKIAIKLDNLAYQVIHEDEDINKLIKEINSISLENI